MNNTAISSAQSVRPRALARETPDMFLKSRESCALPYPARSQKPVCYVMITVSVFILSRFEIVERSRVCPIHRMLHRGMSSLRLTELQRSRPLYFCKRLQSSHHSSQYITEISASDREKTHSRSRFENRPKPPPCPTKAHREARRPALEP
jgi:hypothetical protein